MKRVLVPLALVSLFSAPAVAQTEADKPGVHVGASQWLMNVNYAYVKLEDADRTLDGWGFNMSFEKVVTSTGSLGFNIGAMSADDTVTVGSELNQYQVRTYPAYLMGKYLFGKGRLSGYFGAGIGVQWSTLTTTVGSARNTSNSASFAFNIPVGASFYVSPKVYLNLSYAFNWIADSYFTSDALHLVNLGVGFQFDK